MSTNNDDMHTAQALADLHDFGVRVTPRGNWADYIDQMDDKDFREKLHALEEAAHRAYDTHDIPEDAQARMTRIVVTAEHALIMWTVGMPGTYVHHSTGNPWVPQTELDNLQNNLS